VGVPIISTPLHHGRGSVTAVLTKFSSVAASAGTAGLFAAWPAQILLELLAGFVAADAVPLLDPADQLIAFARDQLKVIVG
jgi:hypothetical protein